MIDPTSDDAADSTDNKVTEVFALLSSDDDGEGIVSLFNPTKGAWDCMVTPRRKTVESLRRLAGLLATANGVPVRLVRFTVREDLETWLEH
jgi:hypothetical protein